MQSTEYTANLQFKATLQASHYHNFKFKIYIFFDNSHKHFNTEQLCEQFLTATNIELLARNAHM